MRCDFLVGISEADLLTVLPATLFQVENTTGHAIGWSVYYYFTAFTVWGKLASLAVNGQLVRAGSRTGSGAPRRELLYVDDLADACVFLMEHGFDGPLINIGTGSDVTIRELAETVMRVVGFTGRIVFDQTKPDGTMRKLMDSSQINGLGRKPAVPLEDGVQRAYWDFLGR